MSALREVKPWFTGGSVFFKALVYVHFCIIIVELEKLKACGDLCMFCVHRTETLPV